MSVDPCVHQMYILFSSATATQHLRFLQSADISQKQVAAFKHHFYIRLTVTLAKILAVIFVVGVVVVVVATALSSIYFTMGQFQVLFQYKN